MSTIKALDTYLDNMAAKLAANPAKAAIYQAKVDAKIAALIAKGKTVTNDGATITSFTLSSGSSGGGSSGSAGTGSSYVLTTTVDAVSGTSKDDTISGIIGVTGTFTVGDDIKGYSGDDTLNLIAITATAAPFTTLDSVETVNVRLLTTAAEVQTINATDWSGTTLLSNNSSLDATILQVSGLTTSTKIQISNDTTINVDFAGLTSGTDSATVIAAGAGSGSAATGLSFATVDLDLDNSGLLDTVNLTVNGSSWLQIEAGDEFRTLNVSGAAGNLVLDTTATETLSSLNMSGFSGTSRVFLSGRFDTTIVGGAGNDTFEFGTALSNGDVINGGNGTDTIVATLGGAAVRVSATNVEVATISFDDAAGGELDLSGAQSITTLGLLDTTGSAVATVTNFVGGTANILSSVMDSITLDTVSNANLVANIGSASGEVSISGTYVTDALNVDLQATGSGTHTISVLNVGSAKTLDVLAAGSANMVLTSLVASAATAISITTNASGSITVASAEAFTGITNFTVNAGGSDAADVSFEDANLFGTGRTAFIDLDTVSLSASSGADIFASGITVGTGGADGGGGFSGSGTNNNAVTISLTAGNGSMVAASAGGTSGIDILASGATLTLNAIANQSGTVLIGAVQMDDAATTSASGVASLAISAAVAQDAVVNIQDVSGSDVAISLGAVTVGASGNFVFASAGLDVGNKTFSMGTLTIDGGSATFGAVSASAMGAITIAANTGATATFGNILSSAIGQISVTLQANAGVDFAQLGTADAAARVSGINVTVLGEGSADFGAILGTGGAVGAITVNVAASGSVDFDTIDASAVGLITVSGAGAVDFGVVSASGTIAGIDLRGLASGGSFTIDMSGVSRAVTVDGGAGTMTITDSSDGSDEFNLKTGQGLDNLGYGASGMGTDTIVRFQAGSADDVITLSGIGLSILDGSGDQVGAGAGGSGGATAVSLLTITTNATAMGADNNIIVITATGFADSSAMRSAIALGGSLEVTTNTDASAGGNLVVVWGQGNDTYVSLVGVTGATGLVTSNADVDNLLILQGVTPGALVAANFDIL